MRRKRGGERVYLRPPEEGDTEAFVHLAGRSRKLHRPWVYPPATKEAFQAYIAATGSPTQESFFVCRRDDGAIAGVINVSGIVRGLFNSAYLGFYAMADHAGRGLMREGLSLALDRTFSTLRLHRLEANIQPENTRSIALVKGLGFRLEGFSPRYLKIGGRWRDHERWAILAEEWREKR